jgi:tetratricopeptide (TPR) repeat protein
MRAERHIERGRDLHSQGRLLEAMQSYARALQAEPDRIETHAHLGQGFAEAHSNLGAAFWMLGSAESAFFHLRRAIVIDPAYAPAYGHLGNALVESGCLDDAREAFDRALERSQDSGWLYRRWAEVRTVSASDAHFKAMKRVARRMSALSPAEQIELHFALAKACADTGDFERAARHLSLGNAQKRATIRYDEAASLALFERIRENYAKAIVAPRLDGQPAIASIFVFGMPRSGTTLVDQVLASHPNVHGAGELTAFEHAFNAVRVEAGIDAPFPEAAAEFTLDQTLRVGSGYLDRLSAIAPSRGRICDKMPSNVLFAGAIARALPNARMILVRRDPLDTCVSCYANLFTGNQPFAYDLGELGRYHRAYDRLVEHWRDVLPADLLLEVRYEDLVADFERVARTIFEHCLLDWDDACLRFYETPRIVRTASAAQVRRPLYRSSVGRYRGFETLLGPLREALVHSPS